MRVSGENVDPVAVADLALMHPAVQDAIAVGLRLPDVSDDANLQIRLAEQLSKRTCSHCGKQSEIKLSKCSACDKERYCDRACQQAAWKAGHRFSCPRFLPSSSHTTSGARRSIEY